MFSWLKNINKKVKDLNVSVNSYTKETDKQVIPTVAQVNRAKKMFEKGQYLEAKDVLDNALILNPKDALVLKYLGVCKENLGDFKGAIEAYNLSCEVNPQDKDIWHKLGMAFLSVKQFEDAEQALTVAAKITPMNTDVQTAWGMSFFKQRKYQLAHEKFINALKINRYNFSAVLLAAIVETRMGKYDDADTKLSFLIKTNPTEAAYYEYANLYFLKDDYEKAVSYAEKSLEINDNMLPAYLLLGRIYSIKFDYAKSINYFLTAQEKELTNSSLYFEWGNALIRLYKFEDAMKMFEMALKEDENCVEAQAGLGLCYAQIGDFDKSDEYIELCEKSDFNSEFILEAKGIKAFNSENIKEAVEFFKKSLQLNSKGYYNYYRLAKCYEKLENDNMIRDSYDKLLKFNPDFVDGYLDYAKFLISQKEYKEAQRKLRKAQNLDACNQEILNLLFYVSYVLVKDNICEYNIKEAIVLADSISDFRYPELRAELETILEKIKEN